MKARPSGRSPSAKASTSRIFAIRPSPAIAPTAIVAPAWSRSRASGCWRQAASASPRNGMKVNASNHRAKTARDMVFELLVSDQPQARDLARSDLQILELGRQDGDRDRPLPGAREGRARPQPSGHGGQSRRLHPLQSLRARLPRSAGQRRDRHGRPRPSTKRSCSISTIRWATRLASPAANACRPVRPAR